jgi:hypothetical protein
MEVYVVVRVQDFAITDVVGVFADNAAAIEFAQESKLDKKNEGDDVFFVIQHDVLREADTTQAST